MESTATPATGITTNAAQRGRFVWEELMTTDPAAAETFYKEVVGWGVTKSDMPGMEYTMFTAGDVPVAGLMGMTADAQGRKVPPNWLAYTEVPNTDETVAQAQSLGAKVIVPPTDIPEVGRFAVLQDPQGAVFAIIASARPLSEETDPTPRTYSWHELATSDLAAGISFYEKIFGWKKQSEFDMGEMGTYHMFGRDRFTYGGMMTKPKEVPYSYWLHYIQVADSADAAAERGKKAGATVVMGPMEVPGGDRVAIMTDPQGAYFAVHSKAPAQ